jgi:predicted alpha/beta-fold hydrolase
MMATVSSPVTMITAADDPVVPVTDFYPFGKVSPHVQVQIQPYGGHVGFIDLFPFRYWTSEVIRSTLENRQTPTRSTQV